MQQAQPFTAWHAREQNHSKQHNKHCTAIAHTSSCTSQDALVEDHSVTTSAINSCHHLPDCTPALHILYILCWQHALACHYCGHQQHCARNRRNTSCASLEGLLPLLTTQSLWHSEHEKEHAVMNDMNIQIPCTELFSNTTVCIGFDSVTL